VHRVQTNHLCLLSYKAVPKRAIFRHVNAVPTVPHLELFVLQQQLQQQLRDNISNRLAMYGIRAQLPKLALPKLAALNHMLEASLNGFSNLESVKAGRAWFVGLLVSLMVMLEDALENSAAHPETSEPRAESNPRVSRTDHNQTRHHALRSRGARVLWCCFRN
jgi:hypothetical protein